MYVEGDLIYVGLYNGQIWCWNMQHVFLKFPRNFLIKKGVLNAVNYKLTLVNSSNSDHGVGNLGKVNAIMGIPGKLYASISNENTLQEWSIKLVNTIFGGKIMCENAKQENEEYSQGANYTLKQTFPIWNNEITCFKINEGKVYFSSENNVFAFKSEVFRGCL